MALPKSAIANPTTKMNALAVNHPFRIMSVFNPSQNILSLTQTRPAGPAGREYARVDAMDGRRPIIEKAIPKTSIIVKFR